MLTFILTRTVQPTAGQMVNHMLPDSYCMLTNILSFRNHMPRAGSGVERIDLIIPFPGRMSQKATKPGSVSPVS